MVDTILYLSKLALLVIGFFCVIKVLSCISKASEVSYSENLGENLNNRIFRKNYVIRKKTEAFLWMIIGMFVIFLGSFLISIS